MKNETMVKALTREWRKFLNGANQRRLIKSFRDSGNDIGDWYQNAVLTGAGTTLQQRLSQAADMANFIERYQAYRSDYHDIMSSDLLTCRRALAAYGWEFTLLEMMFIRDYCNRENG